MSAPAHFLRALSDRRPRRGEGAGVDGNLRRGARLPWDDLEAEAARQGRSAADIFFDRAGRASETGGLPRTAELARWHRGAGPGCVPPDAPLKTVSDGRWRERDRFPSVGHDIRRRCGGLAGDDQRLS
jgi:hypothetical protein